jgi:hypothetical protein
MSFRLFVSTLYCLSFEIFERASVTLCACCSCRPTLSVCFQVSRNISVRFSVYGYHLHAVHFWCTCTAQFRDKNKSGSTLPDSPWCVYATYHIPCMRDMIAGTRHRGRWRVHIQTWFEDALVAIGRDTGRQLRWCLACKQQADS